MSGTHRHSHRILITASEIDSPLRDTLERSHYVTIYAALDSEIALRVAETDPDLVVVEAARGAAGAACRLLKRSHQGIPVLLLIPVNGRRRPTNGAVERILAESGADEVMFRPFSPDDLLANVRALLRVRERLTALESENRALRMRLADSELSLRQAQHGTRELAVLKDAIINNVSHELRTPMLQVKSSIKMLDNEIQANPMYEELGRLLNYATQAASRLESVIQNISQLTTSFSLRIEPFRIHDSMNIALRQLARSWSSANEVGRVQLKLDDVPIVLGDKNGIAQVLQQLIDNGLKFSPDGGPVEVLAYLVDEGVAIVVRDYGIGVDEDQIERIFQEFYQVYQGTTRRYGGVGTGLAIVRLILDGLGVPINVQSRPGEGSAFSFILPLA